MNKKAGLVCKTFAELPSSFEELGMKKEVVAAFELFGVTPEKALKKLRSYSYERGYMIFRKDGKTFLAVPPSEDLLDEYSTMETGLKNTPYVRLNFGDLYCGYDSAAELRINLFEVAAPYLGEYLREDAGEQEDRIDKEWRRVLIHSLAWEHKIRTRGYYNEHYEDLERVHVNADIIREAMKEYFSQIKSACTPEELWEEYCGRIAQGEEFLSWSPLSYAIEQWTETEACNDAIHRSFYIE